MEQKGVSKVRRTRRPVLITRFGKPVAEVAPPSTPLQPRRVLGTMQGTADIVGDIVSPSSDERDWEALTS